nr:MAG TPA: hypothetical protein [Caudoviricetes sp.]
MGRAIKGETLSNYSKMLSYKLVRVTHFFVGAILAGYVCTG